LRAKINHTASETLALQSAVRFMLFRLSDIHKSYAARDVLRGASFQINPGAHVGLVGRNGAGKTTIFRLVSNEETPDRGEVVRARGLKLGLLAQHVHFEKGSTVHESALAAFGRLQKIEHEMHELEHRMADASDELDKVLARYSDLHHEYEREGGFEYSARAEAILQGLGFDRDSWPMETEKLSGGQQNRLGLAFALVRSRCPFARRTNESSRRRRGRMAGRVSANLCRGLRHSFSRPLFPRSLMPAHHRD
jgi:ATP-binding cassette subfamily F protein 3